MDLKVEFIDLNKYNENTKFYEKAIETAFQVPGFQPEPQIKNQVFFVLALADNIPCGVVRLTKVEEEENTYCLRQVFVRKSYRKQGVASKMFELALQELKIRGITKLISFIVENNCASQGLHYKYGFKYTDKGSYTNTDYDAHGNFDEMWVNKL